MNQSNQTHQIDEIDEKDEIDEADVLIDSGTTYSLTPQKVWKAIELSPKREHTFTLADGTTITRKVSECYIKLPQGEGHTPVILGEAEDEALLGVVTLEILGLVFDPFRRKLQQFVVDQQEI